MKEWRIWVGPIGTAITTAGVTASALTSSSKYLVFVLATLLGISLIIVAVQLTKFGKNYNNRFENITGLVDNVAQLLERVSNFMYGSAIASERWKDAIKNTDYSMHNLDVLLEYQDSRGHRVKMTKSQRIIAHQDGIFEIWDKNLKADPDGGSFDWNSIESEPGDIYPDRKQNLGTLYAVPTVFLSQLPLDEIFVRTLKIDFIDCFLRDKEDLTFTSERPVKAVTVTVVGTDDMQFSHIYGEIAFGAYTLTPISKPEMRNRNKIVWSITEPQVGECYRLVWTKSVIQKAEENSLNH